MLRRMYLIKAILLFISAILSWMLIVLPSAGAAVGSQSGQQIIQQDCAQVCSDVRSKLKSNEKKVGESYKQWMERLGVKSDVVRLDQGTSAAEELLKFMSSYYRRQAPGRQMESTFLVYVMSKCFPEAYIDATRARMSGLVNTIWVAENIKIETQINTCK